jgi:hypothetical protein
MISHCDFFFSFFILVSFRFNIGREESKEIQRRTDTGELWSGSSNGMVAEEKPEYQRVLSCLSQLRSLLSESLSRSRGGGGGGGGRKVAGGTTGEEEQHGLLISGLHFTTLTARLVSFLRLPLDFMCGPLPSSTPLVLEILTLLADGHHVVRRYLMRNA